MANQPSKKPKGNPFKKKVSDEFNGDDIFEAPVIVRDPTSRQVKLGGKVSLRVNATGKPLPSYQWFHNGKKIVGANSDRLTLSKVRRTAAGAYHCEVKNHVGKATSRACMVSFFTQAVPKLVIGPHTNNIEDGKKFVLKVTSHKPEELKEFKIFWTFNGMRIKGAHGPELCIAAVKKKYEGEYKALIAAGGGLESSNVAKLTVIPAKQKAEVPVQDEASLLLETVGTGSKTLEDLLADDPTKEIPAAPPPAWDEFNFNPEEEEENGLVAPSGTPEIFGNTSPGTPVKGAMPPLSQLATQDLIREVAAEGGVSNLLNSEEFDISSLLEPKDVSKFVEADDPSQLINVLELRQEQGLHEPTKAPQTEKETPADDFDESLIADWSAPVKKLPPKRPIAPKVNPALLKKKELLENLLSKWKNKTPKAA